MFKGKNGYSAFQCRKRNPLKTLMSTIVLRQLALIGLLVGALAVSATAVWASPGSTYLVSVASDDVTQGDDVSYDPSISGDGRYVAFQSEATNLIPSDTNGTKDVFVRDQVDGTTELVTVGPSGAQGNAFSENPSISGGGRYVAFHSEATNLVSDDTNSLWDVFVRDRVDATTELVSVGPGGTQGNGHSQDPSISADDRYVAFSSVATNLLVSDDTNAKRDVFVYDRLTGSTEVVSVASDDVTQGNLDSANPSISADGRYVAFQSDASNLVSGDTNGLWDVFVHDRQTGTTVRVSVASDGTQGDNVSYYPSISADGRYVAFHSGASNLVDYDSNGVWDVFVHDRDTDGDGVFDEPGQISTVRGSIASDGTEGTGSSLVPSISADGRYVGFHSSSNNLVLGDNNGCADVFVHDRQTGTTTRVSVDSAGAEGNLASANASISANGRYVGFHSSSNNLVLGDNNGCADVFVHDRVGRDLIAHYRFDGHGGDSTGINPDMNLNNTSFINDDDLYLNGLYDLDCPICGYTAVATISGLSLVGFTIGLDFNAQNWNQLNPLPDDCAPGYSTCGHTSNIVTGGISNRWFRLRTDYSTTKLKITLNNQNDPRDFAYVFPTTVLNTDQWYRVIVSVDLVQKRIITFLDGAKLEEVSMPADFQLIADFNWDNQITFTDYSNATTFGGSVDNLIVYNRALSEAEILQLMVDPDTDGVPAYLDNCPTVPNSNQEDADGDGLGDVCDNCPNDYNLNQADNDADGDGDVCDPDDDNDGMPDDWENASGLNPLDPSDANIDTDNDGLSNLAEYQNLTWHYNPDSDGDTINDGVEVAAGTDPMDSDSVPPYMVDDFYEEMVDLTKWADGEFVRRINSGMLESVLTQYGARSSNYLIFSDSGITSFQTDVMVNEVSNNEAFPFAGIGGVFYNDGTSGDGLTGDVIAVAGIGHNGSDLVGFYWVGRCTAADCNQAGEYEDILYGEFGSVSLNETHTVSIDWDDTENEFTFGFDAQSVTPADGLPSNIAPPKGSKWIGTRVSGIDDPQEGGSIAATFDKVYKNGGLYDDFEAPDGMIDKNKWGTWEIVRRIENNMLESALTRYYSNGSSDLIFADANSVLGFQADVTVTDYNFDPAFPTWPNARLIGFFYNDGTGGTGMVGDIGASLEIFGTVTNLIGAGYVVRCTGGDCNLPGEFEVLETHEFTQIPQLNQPYRLSVDWDPNANTFTFGFDGETHIAAGQPVAGPPSIAFKGIGTRIDGIDDNQKWGYIDARFDNVVVRSVDVDTDGDGIVNFFDEDDDDDCYWDTQEAASGTNPLDPASTPADHDGDCITDAEEETMDSDGDLVNDIDDNCENTPNGPENESNQLDADNDDVGDVCDNCPDTPNINQLDTDSDNVGDVCDNAPGAWNPGQEDGDVDEVGNPNPDGIPDVLDNCPDVYNPMASYNSGDSIEECAVSNNLVVDGMWQPDRDCDGIGDPCDGDDSSTKPSALYDPAETDTDEDDVNDLYDNCPTVANGPNEEDNQQDSDNDGIGDACDADDDGDDVLDGCDKHHPDNIDAPDTDSDGVIDSCDVDDDADGIFDTCDADHPDNIDAQNSDTDNIIDSCDNCDNVANPNQTDSDGNGVGDACEPGTRITFTLTDLGSDTVPADPTADYSTWLPRDGRKALITATLVQDGTTIPSDIELTIVSTSTSQLPGKYTNHDSMASDYCTGTDCWDYTDLPPETGDPDNSIRIRSDDYGGHTVIEARTVDGVYTANLTVPMDTDLDGLPDKFEKDNEAAGLNPFLKNSDSTGNDDNIEDLDTSVNCEAKRDGLTNFEEYRGVMWNGSHHRLSPDKKTLFVCGVGFPAEVPFDIGPAFENSGLEVFSTTTQSFEDTGLDVLLVTYRTTELSGGDMNEGHIRRIGVRKWDIPVLGESYFGYTDSSQEFHYGQPTKIYGMPLQNFFEDRPYLDRETLVSGTVSKNYVWGLPNNMLDQIERVEDQNDDGKKGGGEDKDHDGSLTGDYIETNKATWNNLAKLNPFNINNNALVELPQQKGDPNADLTNVDYNKATVGIHVITHEIGHAVGMGIGNAANVDNVGHCVHETRCLMFQYSINWDRAGYFCPYHQSMIRIIND